jgi:hypothetical protein
MSHWFLVRQTYPWLQGRGATDEATDEALALVPSDPFDLQDIEEALKSERDQFHNAYRNKTVRVRAADVPGMIRLLKMVSLFAPGGQLGATIWNRAIKLERIATLDLLADAAR